MGHHHGHSHGEKECQQQDLSGEPIRLPGSPFWNVFKRFGLDEMIALAINTIGTTIIGMFAVPMALLAFVGPVIEKIGFFPAHIVEAFKLHRSIPKERRRSLGHYLWKAIKSGSVSLVEDLLVHDPLYILLFLGLSLYPGIPIWLITICSFLAAVVVVAWLEVAWNESRYWFFRRKAQKVGFDKDKYFETRFFLDVPIEGVPTIIEKMRAGLKLSIDDTLEYRDTYFLNDLPKFSGRSPVLRLRERALGASDRRWQVLKHKPHLQAAGKMQTIQMVYARAYEEQEKRLDQFRFFLIRKEKFYFLLDYLMPAGLESIQESRVRGLLKSAGKPYKQVAFRRVVMRDDSKDLLVTVDAPSNTEHHCVIELKVRTKTYLLVQAMRFVMTALPVTQTTMPKSELTFF